MADVIRNLLQFPTPLWLTAALILPLLVLVLVLMWRLRAITRMLRRHARSIANMDDWADMIDERIERVDWSRTARPSNEPQTKWWSTG